MVVFPNAKINLGLNVLQKRPDGYHDIITGIYPLPVYDVLEIINSDRFSFESEGLPIPGPAQDNLCVKAYHALAAECQLPAVKIILYKNIPMGAGLGGGSADGTFTLLLLNQMYALGLSEQKLEELALGLGSDCPFFVKNQPALARGRGELLSPLNLNLSQLFIVVVFPMLELSTQKAYQAIKPAEGKVEKVLSSGIDHWKNDLQNDFEEFAFAQEASIAGIKEQLYELGASYASMSGSGSAVFGLFSILPKIPAKLAMNRVFTGSLDPDAI